MELSNRSYSSSVVHASGWTVSHEDQTDKNLPPDPRADPPQRRLHLLSEDWNSHSGVVLLRLPTGIFRMPSWDLTTLLRHAHTAPICHWKHRPMAYSGRPQLLWMPMSIRCVTRRYRLRQVKTWKNQIEETESVPSHQVSDVIRSARPRMVHCRHILLQVLSVCKPSRQHSLLRSQSRVGNTILLYRAHAYSRSNITSSRLGEQILVQIPVSYGCNQRNIQQILHSEDSENRRMHGVQEMP